MIGPRWLATGFAGGSAGGRRGRERGRRPGRARGARRRRRAGRRRRAAGDGAARRPGGDDAARSTDRMRSWQLATVALTALEGVSGMWLAFQLDVPPGAAIAVLAGVRLRARGGRSRASSTRAGAAPCSRRRRCSARWLLAGCGTSASGDGDGRPVVVATTTQLGDLARAGRRAGGRRPPDPALEQRPARVRAAPEGRAGRRRRGARADERSRDRRLGRAGRLRLGG